jgi:hypothetical protein
MQHLLGRASWDTTGALAAVGGFVIDRLADPEAVLVFDESGDEKAGSHTVGGVTRQHTGTVVDGRYYIRDNRTVRVMSDAEVVRHHRLRARDADQVDDELTKAVDALAAAVVADQGRLVVVAVPVPLRRPDALRAELSDGGAARCSKPDRRRPLSESVLNLTPRPLRCGTTSTATGSGMS